MARRKPIKGETKSGKSSKSIPGLPGSGLVICNPPDDREFWLMLSLRQDYLSLSDGIELEFLVLKDRDGKADGADV